MEITEITEQRKNPSNGKEEGGGGGDWIERGDHTLT